MLVCVSEPTFPGCVVPVKPIGLFWMSDENGPDDQVVCVPVHDPRWNVYRELDDLPEQLRNEIFHFFAVYKDLDPDRHSEPIGWEGRESALGHDRRGPRAPPRAGGAVGATDVYHLELRQFPHAGAGVQPDRDELDARFLQPWVAGEAIDYDDRRWAPEKTR